MTHILIEAFIYLFASVLIVPIARFLGLGSVLGYLIAGFCIGPILGLVGEETFEIQHFAEFGVVMMLFVVGLELDPETIWSMKNKLLGLGGLQLALTIVAFSSIFMFVGMEWNIALTIGCILSLSSTAIVLQTFNEKHLMKTEGGKNAFSVLLFQDIAVIPMLALLPLLALNTSNFPSQTATSDYFPNFIDSLSTLSWVGVIIISMLIVIVGGSYLSRPLFRFVAKSGLREIFTATALMLVIGISALMSFVGLSPALGTFLAGVVLANSEFRHELETNIDPFKGLLLGLFFITVGAGINLDLLLTEFGMILMLTLGLMMLKTLVLVVICICFNITGKERWLFALSLGQAGEFSFVLLSFTSKASVLSQHSVELILLVVACSMFLTPGLFIFYEKIILRYLYKQTKAQPEEEFIEDEFNSMPTAIIAGVGRFGQIVNRFLVSNGVITTVLDHEASHLDNLRRFHVHGFFGDASRPDLLDKAGIASTKLLILTMDDQTSTLKIVDYVRQHFPNVLIIARAFDQAHEFKLKQAGANFVIKETFHAALQMGGEALKLLGKHPYHIEKRKYIFRKIEQITMQELYDKWQSNQRLTNIEMHYLNLFEEVEEQIKDKQTAFNRVTKN